MTVAPLKKFLLRPVVLSGAVFCLLSLPLAAFGSNQVKIQLQEEPLFHGKLRDIAAPYLGFATVLSLGVAIGSVSVTGWRQSSKKSAQLEEQLSTVEQNLKVTETQLESLKVSELQLQASGLNVFLENNVSDNQPLAALGETTVPQLEAVVTPAKEPVLVAKAAQLVEPQPLIPTQDAVLLSQSVEREPISSSILSEPTAPFRSEDREISLETVILLAQSEPLKQINELKGQFQQMMGQMDTLQQILLAKPESATVEPEVAAKYNPSHNRFNRKQPVVESSSVPANFNQAANQSRQRPVNKSPRQRHKIAS